MGARQTTQSDSPSVTAATDDRRSQHHNVHPSIFSSSADSTRISQSLHNRSNPSSLVHPSNSSSLSGLSLGVSSSYSRHVNRLTRVERSSFGNSNSEDSSPEETQINRLCFSRLIALRDFKCPACDKMVPSDNIQYHLEMCLNRPLITYNEDTLKEDKGECTICLEDLKEGHTIARLPCLCIYHKSCIDKWFKVKRSCPEHPTD